MARAKKTYFPLILFVGGLLLGCGKLKQWAYEGINRDQWQQPVRVIETLRIRPGEQVADLGAGGGYFTFRLAKAVGPAGKVYAVDIDQEMIELITSRAKSEAVSNIEAILARADDATLPKPGVDLIFTCNTYHHIENRLLYFTKLREFLKPGGKIAIIDFDNRARLEGLLSHATPAETIKQEMERAGYVLQDEPKFLDRQSFLIFGVKG
jgi:ubiquinone/menaquinone biosynthesis C-methylase UbiE